MTIGLEFIVFFWNSSQLLVVLGLQIFLWASCWNHCLTALNLGASVEQPFNCLMVQNRQAMQSMGRSIDWTLEDKIVDSLFFCATLTGRRGGHTRFVQAGAETSNIGAEVVKPDAGSSWEGHSGGSGCWCQWWKCGVLWGYPSTPHSIGNPPTAPHVWCCYQLNWWGRYKWVSRFEAPCVCAQWSGNAMWSRCPGSMARCAGDSVAQLRRSSAGWMPVRVGRLSADVGRRQPVTIRKASLMVGSMRRVWALRHQTGTQYFVVECIKGRVAIRRVVAPAPQSEPTRRLRSATHDISFLRSDSRCLQYVTLSYSELFDLGAERQGFVIVFDF